MIARWQALAAGLIVAATPFGSLHATSTNALDAYRGTGSWVSIYDTAAWAHPEQVVQTLAANRVSTLFLETANDKQPRDVVRPGVVSRFLDAAHAAGISVVGWYLPSLATPARDLRRALAGARFQSASGETFDSFALDIEATNVHSLAVRTRPGGGAGRRRPSRRRAGHDPGRDHDRSGRVDVLAGLPVPPAGGKRRRPPADGVLHRPRPRRRPASPPTAPPTRRVVRERVGDPAFPVHPIGGEASRATLPELRAFLRASAEAGSGRGEPLGVRPDARSGSGRRWRPGPEPSRPGLS